MCLFTGTERDCWRTEGCYCLVSSPNLGRNFAHRPENYSSCAALIGNHLTAENGEHLAMAAAHQLLGSQRSSGILASGPWGRSVNHQASSNWVG